MAMRLAPSKLRTWRGLLDEISKSSPVDRDLSRSPSYHLNMKLHSKVFQQAPIVEVSIGDSQTRPKECLAPALETSKTANIQKVIFR
jgi:hypothetical protein